MPRLLEHLQKSALSLRAGADVKELDGDHAGAKLDRAKADNREAASAELQQLIRRKGPSNRPESLAEVIEFAASDEIIKGRWPSKDIASWFDHFEANGWRVSGKTAMKNWHSAARNGFRNWAKDNRVAVAPKSALKEAPEGWVHFCQDKTYDFEFGSAPEWAKAEFKAWRNAQ